MPRFSFDVPAAADNQNESSNVFVTLRWHGGLVSVNSPGLFADLFAFRPHIEVDGHVRRPKRTINDLTTCARQETVTLLPMEDAALE